MANARGAFGARAQVSRATLARRDGGWPRAMCREAAFEMLERIGDGLLQMYGPNVEVVIHDFADPQHSIKALKGNVTRRRVGGSVSEIGLKIVAQGDGATDQIDYMTRTRDGRVLRSSTFVLKDPGGHVFGALCINVDVTSYRTAARLLGTLGAIPSSPPVDVHFTDDIHQVLESLLRDREDLTIDRTTREGRLRIVQALVDKGYFAARGAVPILADFLRVTRATVYEYLSETRATGPPEADDGESAAVAAASDGRRVGPSSKR